MVNLPKAIFLMGPTAAGKTDLAIELFEHLPCELISVDSALIYKGMDIGTAKPDAETLARAPHALIDILEPTQSYSVADFYHDAQAEMQRVAQAGKIPLLVGGTMMYFKVLSEGIAALPSADQAVRDEINAMAQTHGWPHVHAELAKVDPESAARLKPTDSQRIQRALEVFRASGKTLSQYWAEQEAAKQRAQKLALAGKASDNDYTETNSMLPPVPFELVSLAVAPSERRVLHERIALRFEQMLQQGFLAEVSGLRARGDLDLSLPSMRCVGYRQAWQHLDGDYDYAHMKERGIIATRQLAKRQLTWLRGWRDLHWLETGDKKMRTKALKIIESASS